MERNYKTCVICGIKFPCPPSSKKVTCSKDCQKIYAVKRNTGRKFSDESKKKISDKAINDLCKFEKKHKVSHISMARYIW